MLKNKFGFKTIVINNTLYFQKGNLEIPMSGSKWVEQWKEEYLKSEMKISEEELKEKLNDSFKNGTSIRLGDLF